MAVSVTEPCAVNELGGPVILGTIVRCRPKFQLSTTLQRKPLF